MVNKSWLNETKAIAKKFIGQNYSQEADFFEAFWQAFTLHLNGLSAAQLCDLFAAGPAGKNIPCFTFAKKYQQDFITPIVSLTIAEVLHTLNTGKFSGSEIEDVIHSASTRHGAKPGLTACLIRNLPALCNEIAACKDSNKTEAVISQASRPSEYRIWTEGKQIALDSIDKYEKNKEKYLFWLDLDDQKQVSPSDPKATLDPKAVQLFRYLVENIGTIKSINDTIQDIYKGDPGSEEGNDTKKIAQHITQLNNFCKANDKFSSYLFTDWRQNGLGLSDSFKDKYFLFKRVAMKSD